MPLSMNVDASCDDKEADCRKRMTSSDSKQIRSLRSLSMTTVVCKSIRRLVRHFPFHQHTGSSMRKPTSGKRPEVRLRPGPLPRNARRLSLPRLSRGKAIGPRMKLGLRALAMRLGLSGDLGRLVAVCEHPVIAKRQPVDQGSGRRAARPRGRSSGQVTPEESRNQIIGEGGTALSQPTGTVAGGLLLTLFKGWPASLNGMADI